MRCWRTIVLFVAVVAMCAILADNATTFFCLVRLGEVVEEWNPLTNFLVGYWGLKTTMVANALWGAVLVAWLAQQASENRSWFACLLLLALAVVRGWAALHNFHILLTGL